MIVEINREVIPANMAIKKIMKLRQITSGFIYGDEMHRLSHNAKLDALKVDIERFAGEQLIIWANFKGEIQIIKDLLGDKCRCVYGEETQENKQNHISEFKKGKLQYLVANPSSISHGITLTNCHYQIFFSLSDSFERMDQAKDRIHRIGQVKDCFYYFYLCKNTIDEQIYNNVLHKQTLEEFVHQFLNS
jgi:SNF2 family DNA or RNA helicase